VYYQDTQETVRCVKVANSTTRLLLELLEHNHYIILDVVQSGMIGCSMIKLKVVIWLAVKYEFKLKPVEAAARATNSILPF